MTKQTTTAIESAAIVEALEAGADPFFRHDDENRTLAARFIAAGPGNKRQKLYYPKAALEQAVRDGKYSRVPVFRDHASEESMRPRLGVRSVDDMIGHTLPETRFVDGAVHGRIVVADEAAYRRYRALGEYIGISQHAPVEYDEGTVGGKKYNIVSSVLEVQSVDFVSKAGAGGSVLAAEADSDDEGDEMPNPNPNEQNPTTPPAAATPPAAPAVQPAPTITVSEAELQKKFEQLQAEFAKAQDEAKREKEAREKVEAELSAKAQAEQLQAVAQEAQAARKVQLPGKLVAIALEGFSYDPALDKAGLRKAVDQLLDRYAEAANIIANHASATTRSGISGMGTSQEAATSDSGEEGHESRLDRYLGLNQPDKGGKKTTTAD